MIAFRTPSSEMQERMDCNYYHPRYVENARKLEGHPFCVFSSTYKETAIGHTASVEPHYSQCSIGVPFVSGKAIKEFELQTDESERITFESHNGPLADCALQPGDLLIVRKGEVGNACVVPESARELSCASEVIFLEMKSTDEAYFLAAFFNAQHGRLAIERLQRGTIIFGVSLLDIPPLRVFWPDFKVRRYIGDKVRQAERLREHARQLKREIAELVELPELVTASQSPDPRTNRVQPFDLNDRLDSKYYSLRAMSVERAARSLRGVSLSSLGPDVSNGFESRDFVEHGRDYITVSEVSSGRLSLDSAPRIPFDVEIPDKATLTSTCVLVVRTGSIGIAVKAHSEDTDAVISSHLIRLQFQSEETAASVAAFLASNAGALLQHKISYGAVQPQIGQEELLRLPIPEPILQQGVVLASRLNSLEASIRSARRLTTAAKLFVESLIEGKVTEAELITAQEALDRGDNTADRALLRRLTRHGLDVPGQPPLFPDLDAIYALLAQTREGAA